MNKARTESSFNAIYIAASFCGTRRVRRIITSAMGQMRLSAEKNQLRWCVHSCGEHSLSIFREKIGSREKYGAPNTVTHSCHIQVVLWVIYRHYDTYFILRMTFLMFHWSLPLFETKIIFIRTQFRWSFSWKIEKKKDLLQSEHNSLRTLMLNCTDHHEARDKQSKQSALVHQRRDHNCNGLTPF